MCNISEFVCYLWENITPLIPDFKCSFLILDDVIWCRKLTDSSMKVIAETCSKLCTLDLGNLRKLTDSALGFLANACREIHTLKLCRNAFRYLHNIVI